MRCRRLFKELSSRTSLPYFCRELLYVFVALQSEIGSLSEVEGDPCIGGVPHPSLESLRQRGNLDLGEGCATRPFESPKNSGKLIVYV